MFRKTILLIIPFLALPLAFACGQVATSLQPESTAFIETQSASLNEVVIEAFRASHQGWSSDEVILNDELNADFISICRKALPDLSPAEFNWKLINLRKAGKLNVKSTKRARSDSSEIVHVAEIAARTMLDQHSVSIDQIMATPDLKRDFDEVARSVDPEIDSYLARKAAFQLRKARKLRPELITRIADWGREISRISAVNVAKDPQQIAAHPGIYIFSDKTGYLYIGQTDDLRKRLKTHLDQSHNESLATYLGKESLNDIQIEVHSFPPDSRAKETMIRRAYESELIASRKPRFNIQP